MHAVDDNGDNSFSSFLGRVDFSVLVLLGALLCSILATLSLK